MRRKFRKLDNWVDDMNLFSKFMQKSFGNAIPESKSLNIGNTPGIYRGEGGSLVNFLFQNGNSDLAFYALIKYYELCGPFADAVDTIAQEIASIPIRLWDKDAEEYVDEHEVLNFLMYPSADSTQREFMFRLAALYLITGNVFPVATGDRDRPPLELTMYSPHQVTLVPGGDGYIQSMNLHTSTQSEVFTQDEDAFRMRYFNRSQLAEMFPIRRFNPRRDANHLYGISKANSLIYEIEQYISSSVHNLGLLKNGARPGGSFSTTNDMPLSDEQFQRLDEQITKYYQGAANAGRPLLLENTVWNDHIVNNRDMDYATMRSGIMEMIYSRYDIPLSLISTDSMTYDNYETGRVTLYDSAVLPITKTLYEQLAILLLPRYEEDFRRYEFKYEESDIPALEMRRAQKIKLRKEIGVNTVNELRKFLGDEQLDGGDVLLRPSNELPIAMDLYTEDEIVRRNQTETEDDDNETRSAKFEMFQKQMESMTRSDGTRMYTDDEILTRAKKYGIS